MRLHGHSQNLILLPVLRKYLIYFFLNFGCMKSSVNKCYIQTNSWLIDIEMNYQYKDVQENDIIGYKTNAN